MKWLHEIVLLYQLYIFINLHYKPKRTKNGKGLYSRKNLLLICIIKSCNIIAINYNDTKNIPLVSICGIQRV